MKGQAIKHKAAKIIRKTPYLNSAAKKVKGKLVNYVDNSRKQQEIYNLATHFPTIEDYYRQQTSKLSNTGPLISVLLPTYNTPEPFLRECIDSIIMQSYPRWELCIADDASTDNRTREVLKEYEKKDKRIRIVFREKNGHISKASNSALEQANGDFVALMDHDDILWPNALFVVAQTIQDNPDVDHIYTDEDKIDGTGKVHSYPFLKPDFSPEFLESCNYITHFSCIRTSLMKEIGGFRAGYEGAQDWDLFIRIAEKTDRIVHIPQILYSWRIHEASTASDTDAKPYVYEAQLKLLEDHLKRTKAKGQVETGIIKQHRTIKYEPAPDSKLEVIVYDISSSSQAYRFIESISKHKAGCEIDVTYIVPDHVSADDIAAKHNELMPHCVCVCVRAVEVMEVLDSSKAEYLCAISANIYVSSDNWAKILLAEIQRPGIGFVGPVLLSNETTIYSAGLGLGYGSGVQNMLSGMPFDDPHYTRGLYARSRRNVTALNCGVFAVTKNTVQKFPKALNVISMMKLASESGLRNVYTPYIKCIVTPAYIDTCSEVVAADYQDPMLNPNFKKDAGTMEVVA